MQATNIIITGDHVDITLSNDVQRGDTLNNQYIPGTNKVQDLSGNEAAAFNQAVTITLWPNGSCTGLSLVVDSYDQITANWINGSTDETGIVAEISTDQVTWTPTTLAAGTETNTFTGLTASTLYYVQVRAVKDGYYSDYTDVESATTESDIPDVPTGLTAVWVDDFARLTVDDIPADVQIEWYESENGGAYTLVDTTGLDVVTTDNYTWQNQSMAFKCRALKNGLYSDYCAPVTLVTPLVFQSVQTPTNVNLVITVLNITAGKTLNIDWGDETNENVTGNNTNKTHTYSTISTFFVKFTGDVDWITNWRFFTDQFRVVGDVTKWRIPSNIASLRFTGTKNTGIVSGWIMPTSCNQLYVAGCTEITGALPIISAGSGGMDYICNLGSFTSNLTTVFRRAMTVYNIAGQLVPFPTDQIDALLAAILAFYTANAPTANCIYTMNGANMGIPSAQGLADRTAIINLYTAAGRTCTITVQS